MIFRHGPAIVLSLGLSAAALVLAPSAMAGDGGTVKDVDPCSAGAKVKLRVTTTDTGRLRTIGSVWTDDDDVWDWKFRHNGEVSDSGSVLAENTEDGGGKSFRIDRTMVPDPPDSISFRAENRRTEEVCKAELTY